MTRKHFAFCAKSYTGSYTGKSITYLGGEQYERVQKAYGLCSAG